MSYEACYCDYESPLYYSARNVTSARRQYKCDECSKPIYIGSTYERTEANWGDGHETFRTCAYCCSLRKWATISVPCFCWAHGNLLQDIADMVAEVRRDVPGFVFEYGRRVIAIRRAREAGVPVIEVKG